MFLLQVAYDVVDNGACIIAMALERLQLQLPKAVQVENVEAFLCGRSGVTM